MFPLQFEMQLGWNASVNETDPGSVLANTNYVLADLKIDGKANKLMVQTNFSTLSLSPQEFLTFVVDLNKKNLTLKQKDSCKWYHLGNETGQAKLPNIVDLFDLWSYVMYFNETLNAGLTNG